MERPPAGLPPHPTTAPCPAHQAVLLSQLVHHLPLLAWHGRQRLPAEAGKAGGELVLQSPTALALGCLTSATPHRLESLSATKAASWRSSPSMNLGCACAAASSTPLYVAFLRGEARETW